MSVDTHVTDLLPAYALDCLDPEDATRVSEHLATCPDCRAELHAFQAVADRLALAAPEAAPPAELQERLMARVRPENQAARVDLEPSWLEKLIRLWRRAAPAWGVVSLILILALVIGNLALQRQLDQARSAPSGMRVVALSSTDAAPGATGTLILSLDGEHGTLVVDRLPPLDEAHQYQLWLIEAGGERVDGGVFSVNREGYGALWVSSPDPLASYPAFGVTIEPAGGSPGPTGEKVLGGSL